jgi:type VI secretion system protein ImpK
MNASSAPSLLGQQAIPTPLRAEAALVADPRNLLDLLYPGFYMLFLLRNGHTPSDAEAFRDRVKQMLARVDRGAQKLGLLTDDVFRAKFAFCALLDEVVLRSRFSIREAWERKPLQLELFGEHMAGERFFEYLEELRLEGAKHVQALEVLHMCLLLGFEGRHALDGSEKLGYITGRLGDEILHLQGRRAEFAPHWAPPDRVSNKLRREVPLWVIGSVFALFGLVAFVGMRTHLSAATRSELSPFTGIVKLAPQAAYVTISLP